MLREYAQDDTYWSLMKIEIPEDIVKRIGMSERELLIELACHLFQIQRLTLFFASKLAAVSQCEFEDILLERGIPIYRYSEDDLRADLDALRHRRS